ncbi:MAG: hypothetical protein KIS86_04675 [Devosia sp.]|nr:hypothetical protein [Devosia sp.]
MVEVPEVFKTAPAEVKRYFEAKRSQPSFDWRDLAPEEHAFSFTVAKSAGYDVLDDIRAAVDSAITHRVPFEQFQQNLTPILQAKGWWGSTKAVDPQTGETVDVQLGSPRRLRTIYWANTMTAHAAGEWDRTQRNKRFLPFLVYTRSTAENKRPEHEGWVGIVLPVDHPFWDTHYPPNGWLCKCGVRQISRAEAERLGYRPDQKVIEIKTWRWYNKRTGEWHEVPEGVDPGWANNPGKNRAANASRFLYDQLAAMPTHRQAVAIEDIVGSPVLKAMADGKMAKGSFVPIAQMPEPAVSAFEASTPLVRLSSDSVQHIISEYPERALHVADLRQALSVVLRPEAIIQGDRAAVMMGAAAGVWWRVVVKPAKDGEQWWLTSFHRKSEKEALRAIRRARENGKLLE